MQYKCTVIQCTYTLSVYSTCLYNVLRQLKLGRNALDFSRSWIHAPQKVGFKLLNLVVGEGCPNSSRPPAAALPSSNSHRRKSLAILRGHLALLLLRFQRFGQIRGLLLQKKRLGLGNNLVGSQMTWFHSHDVVWDGRSSFHVPPKR